MDSWRSTYRGLVSDPFLDGLRLEDRAARWQKRLTDAQVGEFAYVAEDAHGQVVGFGSGVPNTTDHPDYHSELRALHIAQPYQRKGLGRRLTSYVARHLHDMGINNMLVWVLSGNDPACRFYERLGAVYVTDRIEEFAGGLIPEVGYGWPDITVLIEDET
jgi:ribosomal protein S18 acetylase RimI-like enzyme